MVISQVDESIDYENTQGNIDSDFEYNSIPVKKRQNKEKLDQREFKDNEVISEKDYNESKKKGGIRVTPEKSGSFEDENDRVLHTSFHLSPYSINLISMVKRSNSLNGNDLKILSIPKVILDITSSSMSSFFDIMKDKYITISNINQLASEINASSGKVTINQQKLKIDVGKEEENEQVDSLIMSSVMTKIKMLSEEFGISTSCIVEYLIYMYVFGSDNKVYSGSKRFCEERMNSFITQLDKFISESTQTNIEDENALIRIGFKMAASCVIESTKTNNNFKDFHYKTIHVDMGNEYNINAKVGIIKKNGKRNYDESHSKGIFKQKTGRKSRKINNNEVS